MPALLRTRRHGGRPVVIAPPGPPGLVATGDDGDVSLAWSQGGAGGGVSTWTLDRQTAGSTSWVSLLKAAPVDTVSLVDSAVTNGTAYTYRLVATNASGTSDPVTATATPQAAAAPTATAYPDTSYATYVAPSSGKTLDLATYRDPALLPFSADSPWVMSISTSATFESATAPITAQLLNFTRNPPYINQTSYSHQLFPATLTDPAASVTDSKLQSRRGAFNVSTSAGATTGTDGHMHTAHPEGWIVDEAIGVKRTTDTAFSSTRHQRTSLLGDGLGPNGGVRAYGGAAIGGLIRSWEMDSASPYYTGRIDHPLAIANAPNMMLYDSSKPTRGYVYPATEQDAAGSTIYTGVVPMGTYLAIPGNVTMPSGMTTAGQMIFHALQDYGAYITDVADNSTGMVLYCEAKGPGGFRSQLLANSHADLNAVMRLVRACTSNPAGAVNGGPIGDARRRPLAKPLQSRAFYTPAVPAGFTSSITQLGHSSGSTSFSGSVSLSLPAGLQAGDLVDIHVGINSTSASVSLNDAGYSIAHAFSGNSSNIQTWVYRKRLTGADSGSVVLSFASNVEAAAHLLAFRGVSSSTPEVPPISTGVDHVGTGSASRQLAVGPFAAPAKAGAILVSAVWSTDSVAPDYEGRPNLYSARRLYVNPEEITDTRSHGRTAYFGNAQSKGIAWAVMLNPA